MKKFCDSKGLPTICVILSGVLWGIIAIFVDALKELGLSSIQCAAIRFVFTTIFLLILILFKDARILKISLKDLPVLICAGALGIAVFTLCYFRAIHILEGASVPSLLLNTAPIFVLIIAAIFFKEKITLNKVVALVLALFGVACVSGVLGGGGNFSFDGLIFGVLSGFGYALYSVFIKTVAEKYNSLVINFYAFLTATLIVVPASGIIGVFSTVFSTKGALYSLGLVALCTVLPFLLYSFGLKSLNVSSVSVMAMVDPLTATVIGISFMGESVTVLKIVGIICVFAAIIILNLPKKEKN